jgi:hypothetical protein
LLGPASPEASPRDGTPAIDADGAERTKAVTNRIRQAVARIGEAHQALGLHLGNTVHTGGQGKAD